MPHNFEDVYRSTTSVYGTAPSSQLARYLEKYSIRGPGVGLDIGCGEGRNSILLAAIGFSVLAIDTAPTALARLEQQAKALRAAITCIADDIRAVDLPAAHFTIVVASTVLDHLTKEECTLLVPRILRALTAHGYLYASVFTVVDPGYTLDGPQSDTAKYVKRYFGHGELRDLFPELRTLAYQEEYALDASHGVPHYHGIARILSHRSA